METNKDYQFMPSHCPAEFGDVYCIWYGILEHIWRRVATQAEAEVKNQVWDQVWMQIEEDHKARKLL